ncbi:hypothetical protein, partial [Psychrobacter sp. NPDC078631]|uniref:hypothetical protein n=1 Tax=Psychrobacter sp. NPDC078631 TaxID=3390666 RepID=UPI003D0722FA
VWFAHVRVGHRQLSILDKAPNANALGAFLCARFGDGSIDFSLIYSSKRIAVLIIEKFEGMLFSIESASNS